MVGFQHLRVVVSPTFAVNLCVCYNVYNGDDIVYWNYFVLVIHKELAYF